MPKWQHDFCLSFLLLLKSLGERQRAAVVKGEKAIKYHCTIFEDVIFVYVFSSFPFFKTKNDIP